LTISHILRLTTDNQRRSIVGGLRSLVNTMNHELERHFRRNMIANVSDGTLWLFGFAFLSAATILPVYFVHLSPSTFLLGLIPAMLDLGWFLPQLFTARYVERLPRKKPLVALLGFIERLPFLLMAGGALWFARLPQAIAVTLFFILMAMRSLASGLVATPWQEMVAKVIPVRWRGRFFGLSNGLGGALGLGGAAIAALILAGLPYPQNFALCFLLGFIFTGLSWVALLFTVEPAQTPPLTAGTGYRKRLVAILRDDHNFREYLISRSAGYMGGMAFGFFAVYGIERFHLADAQAAIFTAIMSAAGMVSNVLWGLLGDRRGHKLVMEGATAVAALSLIVTLASNSAWMYYVVFALIGAANAGFILSDLSITMEFGPEAQRPTYIGLARTLSAPFLFVAPLIGGAVAQVWGYAWMFALALGLNLVSLALLRLRVTEPRKA
jgi:MFS family permease